MFNNCFIEHREYLDHEDFARAEQMVRDGMSEDKALGYLRGWAQDMHHEAYCDGKAAEAFELAAYGRDY